MIVFAACGSNHSHVLSVSEIASRTQSAGTVRIDGTSTSTDQPRDVGTISGFAEFNPTRIELTVRDPATTPYGVLAIGDKWYIKDARHEPPSEWCPVGKSDNAFPSPLTVLHSLGAQGWTARRRGSEVIRGVKTTHFRVVRGGDTGMDIWVDAAGRLRRLLQPDDGAGDVERFDFYDYGFAAPTNKVPIESHC